MEAEPTNDKYIKVAVGYAALQVVASTVMVGVGRFIAFEPPWNELTDPWNLLGLVFIACFGVGIYFRSRAAAVAMLLFFIVSRVLMAMSGLSVASSFIGLWIYGHAAKQCFEHHRERSDLDASHSANPMPGILSVVAPFIMTPCMCLGLVGYSVSGLDRVLESNDLTSFTRGMLAECGVVDLETHVRLARLDSSIDACASGVLLTRDSVRQWVRDDQLIVEVTAIPFNEIQTLTRTRDTLHIESASAPPTDVPFILVSEALLFEKELRTQLPQ